MNNKVLTYLIISALIIFFFGFNFLFSLLGNILLLLFLTPLLLIGITFLGINSFKSKIKVCENCGATVISDNKNCIYCGSSLNKIKDNTFSDNASSETIEIEAEEIK